jgi:hypothetical protein
LESVSTATIKLYRAVSDAEWNDIQAFREFRIIPSAMQGRWFAESVADALTWAQRLYHAFGLPYALVEVEVPTVHADLLFRLDNLDNIGPARFADPAQLAIINQTKVGDIQKVPVQFPGTP